MTDDPERAFRDQADQLAAQAGRILGYQAARLGADRLMAFIQGHGEVQAMAMFLVMTTMSVPNLQFSDDAVEALRQDAQDFRDAANRWADQVDQLATDWQAQRQEGEQ